MKRITSMWIVLTAALLAPAAGFSQISCSREGLQRAVDLYIAAQTKGDTSGMPLAMGLGYMENAANADINKGLIKTPMKIDHQRSTIGPSSAPAAAGISMPATYQTPMNGASISGQCSA